MVKLIRQMLCTIKIRKIKKNITSPEIRKKVFERLEKVELLLDVPKYIPKKIPKDTPKEIELAMMAAKVKPMVLFNLHGNQLDEKDIEWLGNNYPIITGYDKELNTEFIVAYDKQQMLNLVNNPFEIARRMTIDKEFRDNNGHLFGYPWSKILGKDEERLLFSFLTESGSFGFVTPYINNYDEIRDSYLRTIATVEKMLKGNMMLYKISAYNKEHGLVDLEEKIIIIKEYLGERILF